MFTLRAPASLTIPRAGPRRTVFLGPGPTSRESRPRYQFRIAAIKYRRLQRHSKAGREPARKCLPTPSTASSWTTPKVAGLPSPFSFHSQRSLSCGKRQGLQLACTSRLRESGPNLLALGTLKCLKLVWGAGRYRSRVPRGLLHHQVRVDPARGAAPIGIPPGPPNGFPKVVEEGRGAQQVVHEELRPKRRPRRATSRSHPIPSPRYRGRRCWPRRR